MRAVQSLAVLPQKSGRALYSIRLRARAPHRGRRARVRRALSRPVPSSRRARRDLARDRTPPGWPHWEQSKGGVEREYGGLLLTKFLNDAVIHASSFICCIRRYADIRTFLLNSKFAVDATPQRLLNADFHHQGATCTSIKNSMIKVQRVHPSRRMRRRRIGVADAGRWRSRSGSSDIGTSSAIRPLVFGPNRSMSGSPKSARTNSTGSSAIS